MKNKMEKKIKNPRSAMMKIGLVIVAMLALTTNIPIVGAATGDVLKRFSPSNGALGGTAFDGVDTLYYIPNDFHEIRSVKTDGTGDTLVFTAPIEIRALAYDSKRNGLWVGRYEQDFSIPFPTTGHADNIWFFDLAGKTLSFSFKLNTLPDYSPATCPDNTDGNFIDGLQYDPSTDSLWIGEDCGIRVYHTDTAGKEIGFFDAKVAKSGIGLAQNLWLGEFGGVKFDEYTTGGVPTGMSFAPASITEIEGISRSDNKTFAPKCALWAIDKHAGNEEIAAYEVPCGVGGPPSPNGSISGMKFNDLNGNGKKDPGEPGLAGWHIKLVGVDTLTNTPVNREEITDANGNYGFMDVSPGIYQVFEVMQGPNWVPTTPVTVPINLKAGETINVNFGNKQIP